jgi:predicted ATPase/class 3 adenylate cyclase
MAAPPTGTVTFFFSDIEGSTRIASAVGSEFPNLLDEHNRLLGAVIGRQGGSVINTEGDSFFAAFPSARQAVSAAVGVQRALADHAWPPEAEIRVRIGLHTGEATLRGDDYAGLEVHRAARIMAAGWGGQILASDAVRALAGETVPEGASLLDLGEYTLKDFPDPQHLFQVVAPGLRTDFPPPRTESPARTNLPAPLTRFVGRTRELEELRALLADSHRLVTLTGPGGSGKTRLSIEAARSLSEQYPDGVWFVALEAVRDQELVLPTIAQALELREVPGRPISEVVAERLRDERILCVFDNFEQVVDAAPAIADLLQATTSLRILTSSRQPLMIAGERIYPVPPLDVPADPDHATATDLEHSASIELFVDRARATQPGFVLTDDNAKAVVEICRHLDGLPLAIELAAARVNVLSPEQIAKRLGRQLGLLASARRDVPERQRTLRAAIDWSHDLLTQPQRVLFRRLSVFAGGADLEAVEAVVDPTNQLGEEVLDLTTALVERSLLHSAQEGGDARLRMLETIREYASDQLAAAGETGEIQARHAAYYLAMAEAAAVPMPDARRNELFVQLDRELGNLRAILSWSLATGDIDAGLRLATELSEFWHTRNHLAEGISVLEDLIAASSEQGATPLRARGLVVAGGLYTWQADERAGSLSEQGIAMAQEVGDMFAVAMGKSGLAWSMFYSAPEQALLAFEDGAAAATAVGADALSIETVTGQAWTNLRLGRLEDARRLALEVIAIGDRVGAEYMTTFSLVVVGWVDGLRGDRVAALRRYAEALRRSHAAGAHVGTALALEAVAAAALDRGDVVRGVRLSAAAERLRRESGAPVSFDFLGLEAPLVRARSMMDSVEYEAAVNEGRTLSVEDAVAVALNSVQR